MSAEDLGKRELGCVREQRLDEVSLTIFFLLLTKYPFPFLFDCFLCFSITRSAVLGTVMGKNIKEKTWRDNRPRPSLQYQPTKITTDQLKNSF